jgi:hypothetical protein
MRNFKTLNEFATEIYKNKNSPGFLADIGVELSAKYGTLSEKMKDNQLEKAQFWTKKIQDDDGTIREKPLSDKHVEMMWIHDGKGEEEIRLKYEMKALEKMMSAIKNNIVVSTVEARNQY